MNPKEPLNVRSRKHWEAVLKENLLAAETEYRAVSKEHGRLMATAGSLGMLNPDGCAAVENAIAIQRYVLEKYEKALREFSDLIHYGRTPARGEPALSAPQEASTMRKIYCGHCARAVLSTVRQSSAPDGKSGWVCMVCGASLGSFEPNGT